MTRLLTALTLAFAFSLTACGGDHDHKDHKDHGHKDHDKGHDKGHDKAHAGYTKATVTLAPTAGNDGIAGTVTFVQADGKVTITANVSGLTPGKHGFHIHEFGDISMDNGKGTGGHFNPEGHDHALADNATRHAGDLGNLDADKDGNATYTATVDNITIAGKNAILGRAIIVHAKEDDGGQPTGNAGARIAQGVIGVAK